VEHRLIGVSLLLTGEIAESRAHLDQALALYDPAQHLSLETRFGQDFRVATLAYRSWTLWLLGYPQMALLDAEQGLKNARESGQAAGLMYALLHTAIFRLFSGSWTAGKAEDNELVKLAASKGVLFWKAQGVLVQGCLAVLTKNASEGVDVITSGMPALHQTGASAFSPFYFSYLAQANAEIGRYEKADRLIEDVMTDVESTKQNWWAAEAHRIAGEIALKRPATGATIAETHFAHALDIARAQQAKSWELRASMSLARLWRDQGKPQQARELLAPVYGWFTEGFDTLDLKEAKKLLDELHA
jgi:predicted ATPase